MGVVFDQAHAMNNDNLIMLVGLIFLANLSRTYMRNETNACRRKKNAHQTDSHPIYKASKGQIGRGRGKN